MKDRFNLLIFDWDGTLVDSIDWIVYCVQASAKKCGCATPSSQAAKDIIGLSIYEAAHNLFPLEDLVTHQHFILHYGELLLSKQTTADDLFSGVETMLAHLKQAGYQLAIASGRNRVGLNNALQETGIGDLFSATRCAEETASKPNPLMLEEIMQHIGISSERTLMIGDSTHDLQMAKNAQVASIGVTCGVHPANILQQYQPLFCLEQTTRLLEKLVG